MSSASSLGGSSVPIVVQTHIEHVGALGSATRISLAAAGRGCAGPGAARWRMKVSAHNRPERALMHTEIAVYRIFGPHSRRALRSGCVEKVMTLNPHSRVPPTPTVTGNLPLELTSFVGR